MMQGKERRGARADSPSWVDEFDAVILCHLPLGELRRKSHRFHAPRAMQQTRSLWRTKDRKAAAIVQCKSTCWPIPGDLFRLRFEV